MKIDLFKLLQKERLRQSLSLEMIPSENYVSEDVLRAQGSEFTNKYSEGYPGKRYYGGQEFTDQVELEAIHLAKELFNADHANVQPHSGAQANQAVYFAWLEPGDTVLGMDLSAGGHLTHGSPVTLSAQIYNFVSYGVKDLQTAELDYDQIEALAKKHRPKILLAGFSAYPKNPDWKRLADIAHSVGALPVADIAHIAGLVAAGALPNPLDLGFNVLTSTTHKTLRGPRGGLILSKGLVSSPLKKPKRTIANIPTLIDRAVFPGTQGGPQMHSILAKAVCLQEAGQPEFKLYAKNVISNAKSLAKELIADGLSLVGSGTDNHLVLIDIQSSLGFDGKTAEQVLESIGITTNANSIPFDSNPPFRPSGLRLGTPALTTRGFNKQDITKIAKIIVSALRNKDQPDVLEDLKKEVLSLAESHPTPTGTT
jgi:glycine hydroxymethyltransferase